jgi:hypothetical protein
MMVARPDVVLNSSALSTMQHDRFRDNGSVNVQLVHPQGPSARSAATSVERRLQHEKLHGRTGRSHIHG